MDQRGVCDDARIVPRWRCKSLNDHTNITNDSDYAKGFFPEMFSWIRIRIQKGFYDQENAVEKKAKYSGGGRQEVSLTGSGFDKKKYFFYRIRIQKAKKI
jgi:hypothetical protein